VPSSLGIHGTTHKGPRDLLVSLWKIPRNRWESEDRAKTE
jgi:hypothetical protein